MSYDVTVGDDWQNYTSNMRVFFAWAIGQKLTELHGMNAPDAERLLTLALVRIAYTPVAELQKFDSPNGWGSWDTATDFLRRIRDALARQPLETIEVSS